MISTKNQKRHFNWTQCPRDVKETRWSKHYVSLNREGILWLSRFTHQAMGEPDSYLLMYDRDLNVIGLQPARLAVIKNAYPAIDRGKFGGRCIYAHRMMREFSLYIDQTARFPRAYIDHTGTLILELNDVKPVSYKSRDYND